MICFHIFSAVNDTRVEYMQYVQSASMPQIHFFSNHPEALLSDHLQVRFEEFIAQIMAESVWLPAFGDA